MPTIDNWQFKPLVSIITPSLNQADYIEKAILSVKRQTYPNIEHIVVDGRSTDTTVEILRRHQGSPGLRWLSEPDQGMYQAINKGLRLTTGSIVGYLNADDLYFPWTVETVVEAMAAHPDAGIAYGDVMKIREFDGTLTLAFTPPFDPRSLVSGFRNQPAWFWRREVSEQLGGFDEALQYAADLDFVIQACMRFRSVRIDEFLALDRLHLRAKRYTVKDTGTEERKSVSARYRAGGIGGRFEGRLYFELHKSVWKRYLLFRFLIARASWDPVSWRKLLSAESFDFVPLYKFAACFLPFGYHALRLPAARVQSTILQQVES